MESSTTILLTGIHALGRHGANPGEQLERQEFVVDLEVVVDVGQRDSLEDTVDYRSLADLARTTVEQTSFHLLESLAEAVARAVYDLEPVGAVRAVTATVHKPRAAGSVQV